MIGSGSLSDRIGILKPVVSRSERGTQEVAYKPVTEVWANVKYKRGSYALSHGETWMSHEIAVTIRYTDMIDKRCRIAWNDQRYRIESFNASKREGSISITATVIDETNNNYETL